MQLFLLSRQGPKSGSNLSRAEAQAAHKALRAAEQVKLNDHIKDGKSLRPKAKANKRKISKKVGLQENDESEGHTDSSVPSKASVDSPAELTSFAYTAQEQDLERLVKGPDAHWFKDVDWHRIRCPCPSLVLKILESQIEPNLLRLWMKSLMSLAKRED